jgi:anti-sigma regulatory factor (Ser/Thr protein kinase)
MEVKEIIIQVGEQKKVFKTSDVSQVATGYARQYISRVISKMVDSGELIKEGSGRWSTYALPKFSDYLGHQIRKKLDLDGLKEHEVLDDIMRVSTLLKRIPENVQSIFNYSFSEMLNNAIDHSQSKQGEITVVEDDSHKLRFIVKDQGIGVFKNVMRERRLKSEIEAIQDLLKGKTTTAPQAHSGEGIFFTSKVADVFVLDSYEYRLRIDNILQDIFVEEIPADKQVRGTRVTFEISANSKKHLNDIFHAFQSDAEEPAFDKTEIQVRLYVMGTIYVSRSQARRVLTGLEKFRTVVLDFSNVPTIGQAFADEIFRVFQNKYPDIVIKSVNMNEAVSFMVTRAKA